MSGFLSKANIILLFGQRKKDKNLTFCRESQMIQKNSNFSNTFPISINSNFKFRFTPKKK